MIIEARLAGQDPVFVSSKTGQRDDDGVDQPREGPNLPGDFVTVQARKSEVEEDDVGAIRAGHDERLAAFVGRPDIVAQQPQQGREAFGRVAIVIDHEDAPAGSGEDLEGCRLRTFEARGGTARQWPEAARPGTRYPGRARRSSR